MDPGCRVSDEFYNERSRSNRSASINGHRPNAETGNSMAALALFFLQEK